LIRSPILGDAGNAEFLLWIEPPAWISKSGDRPPTRACSHLLLWDVGRYRV